MSSTKDQLYGNSTRTKSSCQMKYFYTGCVQQIQRKSVYGFSGLYKHTHQQLECMSHAMFVSVCTIIIKQVYCMPHTCLLTVSGVLCTRVCENMNIR